MPLKDILNLKKFLSVGFSSVREAYHLHIDLRSVKKIVDSFLKDDGFSENKYSDFLCKIIFSLQEARHKVVFLQEQIRIVNKEKSILQDQFNIVKDERDDAITSEKRIKTYLWVVSSFAITLFCIGCLAVGAITFNL